jgi:hypothetical protein
VSARDVDLVEVDASATHGQPVQRPAADVGHHDRKPPEHQTRVGVGERARHPENTREQLPDELVDEVLAEWPPTQGDDHERRAPDLNQQVAGDEQPRAPVEGVGDRDGHQQAGEHQPDQERPHGQPVRVEPVRPPGGVRPGVDDRQRQDRRLGTSPQVDIHEQVV